MGNNNFAEITADQVWIEDFMTTPVNATDIEYEMIAFFQMSLLHDNYPRLPDEQTTQHFQIHRNQNRGSCFRIFL